MILGCPHPMMMAAGGHWDSHYKIEHSLRFRSPAAPYMWRAVGAGVNRKTGFLSLWAKPSMIVAPVISANNNMHLFICHNGSNVAGSGITAYSRLALVGDGTNGQNRLQLHSAGSAGEAFASNNLFRDLNAHGHLYMRWDSTIPMLECYWNGVEISYASRTLPTLNADTMIGLAGAIMALGMYTTADPRHFDGYLSEPRIGFGVAPDVTEFGRICPEKGHWEPISYSGNYGAQGSYLDFSDGSAATSATLGKDRSGNNNDWTPSGVSVAAGAACDWMSDTPTNRYCTLNSLAYRYGANHSTETDGLLTCAGSQPGAATYSYGSMPFSTGKFVAEAIVGNASGSFMLGVCNPSDDSQLAAYINSGQKVVGGTVSAYGAAFTTGDVIAIEADADAKTIEFFKQTGGAGSFVSQGLFSIASLKFPLVFHCQMDNTAKFHWTFGQRAMAHTASAGFKTLCAANEPEPAIARRKSAFVAVADTGANIAATLASARAGWADYIEIFKRRDSAEGWRWRFASDLGNYLDSSSTAEKAVFPALTGTSYVGYALKVSAQNGVATGTFAHVNGVADTINDGLGTARKAIILRRESVGGGDWAFYHPDLTAGKLLFLNLGDAEATNATISGVTSAAFIAAAALPSGTYRWISIAELSGLIGLGRHVGNYSTDGPMDCSDHSPALVLIKNKSRSACTWILHDSVRSPFNPSNNTIYPNNNSQENASPNETIDMLSSGFKLRNISSDINYTAPDEYVYLSIGQSSRYANAR